MSFRTLTILTRVAGVKSMAWISRAISEILRSTAGSTAGTGLVGSFPALWAALWAASALVVSLLALAAAFFFSKSFLSSPSSLAIFLKWPRMSSIRRAVLGSTSSASSSAVAANSRKPRAMFLSFLAASTIRRISSRTTRFVESAR